MTTEYEDRVAFYVAHRQMEAAGLGTLINVGGSWEWMPTREGSTSRGSLLRAAAALDTYARSRLRDAVKAAAREGRSLREIAADSGLTVKVVRGMLA